jgi:hypothetical protein
MKIEISSHGCMVAAGDLPCDRVVIDQYGIRVIQDGQELVSCSPVASGNYSVKVKP